VAQSPAAETSRDSARVRERSRRTRETLRCAHLRRSAREAAGFRGGRRRRSNSGQPNFATASALWWPTSSDESQKRKRRSRRSGGAAHRPRSCTGATGISPAAEGHGDRLGQAQAVAFQGFSIAGKRREAMCSRGARPLALRVL
jgi:hypothetical protein